MPNQGGLDVLGVSIALATFNGEKHIRQQLDSLASQTRPPAEVVITDDGSTDRTLEIAEDFRRTAKFPVRIYRNETRLGYADNFLRAGTRCSSPLIAFCDQDDLWSEDKLEVCIPYFEDPQVLLSAHSSEVWDGEKVTGKLYPEFSKTGVHSALTLDPFLLVPGFVMVLRRRLIEIKFDQRIRNVFTLGGKPAPMGHDQWAWFLATVMGKVVTIAESKALYRQHAMNVVGAPKRSGFLYNLSLAAHDHAYAELAEIEGDAARVAGELQVNTSGIEKQNCEAAVRKLLERQQFHAARARIYDEQSGILTRLKSFWQVLSSGGYRDDEANFCLGRRAAVKDLIFGVPRLYRFPGLNRA